MNTQKINIAISGLGLLTIEDIKERLIKYTPETVKINWTVLSDKNLDCLLINDDFFHTHSIQNIINGNNISFLRITKKNSASKDTQSDILSIPITNEEPLKKLIQECIKLNLFKNNNYPSETNTPLSYQFFNKVYSEYCHKLVLSDDNGTIAVIDHHAHTAWPCLTRKNYQTNASINYQDAITSDLLKISRKKQINLENWIFKLIYSSESFLELPDNSAYFKIIFWPQPFISKKKEIIQLSAAFALGAQISTVATNLNIPIINVQKFIVANQSIQNIEQISVRDAKFATHLDKAKLNQETISIHNIFQKFKRKFGF